MPKHPNEGDVVPDGKILSIEGGEASTLLTEAKKIAAAAGSAKGAICFDAITCPFFRACTPRRGGSNPRVARAS